MTSESLPGDFRVPFYLPEAPEIDYFVGREFVISSIEQTLLPASAPGRKVVALHGAGGMGKTQVASNYAIQHQQDYTVVLWFNATDQDSLRQSFQLNAGRFPKEAVPPSLLEDSRNTLSLEPLVQAVKRWLALPQNDKWLLIFDNHDNPKIPQNKDSSSYDIRPYFPEAYQGSILLTTRWANVGLGKAISISKLEDEEQALSILASTSGRSNIREGKFQTCSW